MGLWNSSHSFAYVPMKFYVSEVILYTIKFNLSDLLRVCIFSKNYDDYLFQCHRISLLQTESFQKLEHTINMVVVVQLLSHVQLFVTPWSEAHHVSLSFTISQRLLKFMSIESVMLSNLLHLCCLLLFCLHSFIESGSFPMSRLFASGGQSIRASASATALPMMLRVNFLQD